MSITVSCTQCGKSVERKPSEAKCENSFCSRECYDIWRSKKRVTVSCSNCGKTFDVHAYRQGNPNYFCGRKCQGEWMSKNITGQNHWNYVERVKINCACCGVEMERVPNNVGEYNFCSRSCANKSTSLWAPKERVTVRCSYCGKPIERHPRTVNKTNFCNHGCMGKWFSENWVGENHPMSKEKIEVRCACCNKPKMVSLSQFKYYKIHFCNKKCGRKWMARERVTVKCSYCNKPIEKSPSSVRDINFCNLGCMGKWRSENNCGENNPSWLGGTSFEPYPVTWNNKLREAIRNRDNRTCQLCGVPEVDCKKRLEVHHIDYDKNNLDYTNLISLCVSCHRKTNHRRDEWLLYFKSNESTFPECKEVAL